MKNTKNNSEVKKVVTKEDKYKLIEIEELKNYPLMEIISPHDAELNILNNMVKYEHVNCNEYTQHDIYILKSLLEQTERFINNPVIFGIKKYPKVNITDFKCLMNLCPIKLSVIIGEDEDNIIYTIQLQTAFECFYRNITIKINKLTHKLSSFNIEDYDKYYKYLRRYIEVIEKVQDVINEFIYCQETGLITDKEKRNIINNTKYKMLIGFDD